MRALWLAEDTFQAPIEPEMSPCFEHLTLGHGGWAMKNHPKKKISENFIPLTNVELV